MTATPTALASACNCCTAKLATTTDSVTGTATTTAIARDHHNNRHCP
jgi:hypothetical protein